MPKGPRGERRPADVIGCAVQVMRIATGEVEDTRTDPGKEYMRKGGLKGGPARAKKLSPTKRKAIAKKAAAARWGK
ncbi:MAG: RNA-binding protein [Candidatus Binatia bacterium]